MKAQLGAITHLCIVVPDIEAAVRRWSDDHGVGPWNVWTHGPDALSDLRIEEAPAEFTFRVALARFGPIDLELIQPLDDRSPYAQSLRRNGGEAHLHHMQCTTADHAGVLEQLHADGGRTLMSASIHGADIAYLPTAGDLGAIVEISRKPAGFAMPPPDFTYPS